MKRRLAITALLAGAGLAVTYLPALAASATGTPAPQETATTESLNFFQAVLVALGLFLTNSAFTPNIGFNVFRWPLMAGTVVGLIMGDVGRGIQIGALINLPFIGVIAAGGSQAFDPSLAGWLGTALAMSAKAGEAEAVAIAVPLGILGLLPFFSRMNVDVLFVRWADARAERGDIDGVARMNWVPGQIYVFIAHFIPVLLLAYYGSQFLNPIFAALDPYAGGDWSWIRNWLIVSGSMLVTVGIAINLNLILRGSTIPYFLIGFTISALTGVNLVAMAVLAGSLAALHVMFTRRQNG